MPLSGRGVTAVLGRTNSGKTHYDNERMVAHSSGIIGLPLRLLARGIAFTDPVTGQARRFESQQQLTWPAP